MKSPVNSELRRRILLTLGYNNASSIAALARDLDTKRSSVSRTVKSLQAANLITRQGRILLLTEAGQEEAQKIKTDIPVKVKKATDLAAHILEKTAESWRQVESFPDVEKIEAMVNEQQRLQPVIDRMLQITENLPSSLILNEMKNLPSLQMLKAAEKLLPSPQMISTMKNLSSSRILNEMKNLPSLQMLEATERILPSHQIFDAMKSLSSAHVIKVGEGLLPSAQLFKGLESLHSSAKIAEAINATVRIQMTNLDWIQSLHSKIPLALNHLVIKNNAILGNMMVDLEAIAKIRAGNNHALTRLIDQTAETTKHYDAYFRTTIQNFTLPSTTESLGTAIIVPTTATASLVSSTRSIVESQSIPQEEEESISSETTDIRIYSERYLAMPSLLESYLRPLGERFINKWDGAWQALYSGNKDRHSQATHSSRELLMQVLEYLAPNEVFTEEDLAKHRADKVTRKMRIKYILRSSNKDTISLINSMADTLDNMYHILVGEAHRRDDNHKGDDAIAAMIAGFGNFLIMLLTMRNDNQS